MYTLHTSIFLNLITKHQFRNVQSTPLDVQLHNSRIINESNSPSFHGGNPQRVVFIYVSFVKMYVIWCNYVQHMFHMLLQYMFLYGSKYYKYFYTTNRSLFWIINLIIMHIEYGCISLYVSPLCFSTMAIAKSSLAWSIQTRLQSKSPTSTRGATRNR